MTYTKNTGRSYTQCRFPKGFTLIELLVVVLIIGILAAVAVPQYKKAAKRTRYAEMLSIATSIGKSAELYYLENGTYPTSLADLNVDIPINYLQSGIHIGFDNNIRRIYVTLGAANRTGNGYVYHMGPYGSFLSTVPGGIYCFQSVDWNNNVKPDGMCSGKLMRADAYGGLYQVKP